MTLHLDSTADAAHPFDRVRARLTLLVALAGAVPGMLLVWFWRGHFSSAWTVSGVVMYGLIGLALVLYGRSRGVRLGRLFGPRPTWGAALLAAGLAVTVLAFSLGTILVIFGVLGMMNPALLERVREGAPGFVVQTQGHVDILSSLVRGATVALGAPIVEELLFRGFLFTRWSRVYGARRGLIFSALLFGLLHASLQPLGAFALGLVAALLFLRTRSLWTPIIAHATNNTIVVVASSWGEHHMANAGVLPQDGEFKGLLVFGLGLFAVSTPVLLLTLRRLWPAADARLPYDDA